jgi:hypothetical protein
MGSSNFELNMLKRLCRFSLPVFAFLPAQLLASLIRKVYPGGKDGRVWRTRKASADLSIFPARIAGWLHFAMENLHPRQL